ncbi:helix-turn-helix transcriptional regulator [Piscinibacter sakaiensis]|uniref:HTH cro/C1-type domain-containing protein n=1 Tax=Piscinibacter sakaiensis TaxID=1547922 RepID=A0A0K8P8S2_PISS1|nr:helix-turn-helix transcriptional regulator [Piscinibacter sakaiensis]GAP39042.1 hypothetical protein ISF6_0673 [Piscinibacter sakaiensis]
MDFSTRLRAVIGNSTIDDFAAALGESPQRVKDVLRAKQKPPFELLLKLHERCGVDLNWLVTGSEPKSAGPQLRPDQAALLRDYDQADEIGRQGARRMLRSTLDQTAAVPAVKTQRTRRAA